MDALPFESWSFEAELLMLNIEWQYWSLEGHRAEETIAGAWRAIILSITELTDLM